MIPTLAVRALSLARGRRQVLSEISLSVEANELVVIMGPSGAGKSTLLRAICGLQRVSAGSILIDGEDVTHKPPHQRATALLMDEDALFPHMTVAENVSFAVNTHLGDASPREQIDTALTSLGIAHLARRYPGQLSLGQRQTVGLARVLVRRPRVLLVDEPLAHVDTLGRETLKAELVRVHRRMNCATLYVTHDVEEAFSIADRIVYLSDGVIRQDDYPEEVHDSPATLSIARHLGATTVLSTTGTVYRTSFDETRVKTTALGHHLDVAGSDQMALGDNPIVLVGYPSSVSITPLILVRRPRITGHIGQVTNVTFMGEHYITEVETELGCLVVRLPTDAAPVANGDLVRIALHGDRLWALPAQSA